MSRAENIVYILEDFYYNYFIWYVILEFISLTNSVRNSQKSKGNSIVYLHESVL